MVRSERLTHSADTIVALATAPGMAAIAVVRMSGPDALAIREKVAPKAQPLQSHRLYTASLLDDEKQKIDDAMVVEMHAPRSYTGEHCVEFHLHGSPAVQECLLETCLNHGARLARPGEFTMRAFLAGKLSLDQAESVHDLIASKNRAQVRIASAQLSRGLQEQLAPTIHQLEGILAEWRAAFDFPEHPTGDGMLPEHFAALEQERKNIAEWVELARPDMFATKKVVLCGAPNSGKSSLLNALSGQKRALVSDTPGTTRDAIQVELGVGPSRWTLWDTAGLRDGAESIEQEGIALSHHHMQDADLCLWVVDMTDPQWPDASFSGWLVLNKIDLAQNEAQIADETQTQKLFSVSAKTRAGIQGLREAIDTHFSPRVTEVSVVKQRHLDALKYAHDALVTVLKEKDEATLDVLSFQLEEAVHALGNILGRHVEVDVLDRIFSEFCIGK